jgi:hypothetical protein
MATCTGLADITTRTAGGGQMYLNSVSCWVWA